MSTEKIYTINNLGCANCAAKMEARIQNLPGVEDASITYMTKQLRVNAENPDALFAEMEKICQSIEGETFLSEKSAGTVSHAKAHDHEHHDHDHEHHHHEHHHHEHHHGDDCCCCGHEHEHEHHDHDHEHEHHHEHTHEHGEIEDLKSELIPIIIGAILYAGGIVMEKAVFALSDFAITDVVSNWQVAVILAIYLAAYIILGREVLMTSARNISHGEIFDENFLMSVATIAAFGIGDFKEAVGVMMFFCVGELFEDIAVSRSRSQIMDTIDMRPETVNLVCEADHGHETEEHTHEIPAETASIGDILLIRPGDRIPLDGRVVYGETRVDTSAITGEPVPVAVRTGDDLTSGWVNQQGLIRMEVTKPLSESMVTKIMDSVENAASRKPKIDRFITKFARVYTPIVCALAVAVAVIPSLLTGDWNHWLYTAVTFLVISCPCALVISVPLAFFLGIGAASKHGILFKGGLALEALRGIKAVVMDKTGTITRGEFAVQEIAVSEDFAKASGADPAGAQNALLTLAATCESASTHPIAVSIIAEAAARGIDVIKPKNIEEISGHGIHAELSDGRNVLAGNIKLMNKFGVEMPADMTAAQAATLVYMAVSDEQNGYRFAGIISIADTIKEDAKVAIQKLKSLKIIPAMLTGDNLQSATAVAGQAGIDVENVRAQLLPDEKVSSLDDMRQKHGSVMFVGDGINDAPVLAGADVSAAMGAGADAAIEAADVIFMKSNVDAIPISINLARKTGAIAKQNIVIALAIKLAAIILGLVGFANIWFAIFADTGVTVICILNSLRILWKNFD